VREDHDPQVDSVVAAQSLGEFVAGAVAVDLAAAGEYQHGQLELLNNPSQEGRMWVANVTPPVWIGSAQARPNRRQIRDAHPLVAAVPDVPVGVGAVDGAGIARASAGGGEISRW
jgi:hypothetical protein